MDAVLQHGSKTIQTLNGKIHGIASSQSTYDGAIEQTLEWYGHGGQAVGDEHAGVVDLVLWDELAGTAMAEDPFEQFRVLLRQRRLRLLKDGHGLTIPSGNIGDGLCDKRYPIILAQDAIRDEAANIADRLARNDTNDKLALQRILDALLPEHVLHEEGLHAQDDNVGGLHGGLVLRGEDLDAGRVAAELSLEILGAGGGLCAGDEVGDDGGGGGGGVAGGGGGGEEGVEEADEDRSAHVAFLGGVLSESCGCFVYLGGWAWDIPQPIKAIVKSDSFILGVVCGSWFVGRGG